ncbi:MAG: carboxypeptidase-like regulatory domain-containing protein, partial [Acidobacteriaceae bacterium]|nr:carboxypeptidase-like regulatory domain-containing protein [Acidobacteriaceae bacterium]
MSSPRGGQRTGVARILSPVFSLFSAFAVLLIASTAAAADIAGEILDPSGHAIPRAFVRIVTDSGTELSAGFADETGRFVLTGTTPCQIDVSLSGFSPATIPCPAGNVTPVVVTLALAPVREAVIVSATRTDAPLT